MAVHKRTKIRMANLVATIERESNRDKGVAANMLLAQGWEFEGASTREVYSKGNLVIKLERQGHFLDQNRREAASLIHRITPLGKPLDREHEMPSGRCLKFVAPEFVAISPKYTMLVTTKLTRPHRDYECRVNPEGRCPECRVDYLSGLDERYLRDHVTTDSCSANFWATDKEVRLFDLGYSANDLLPNDMEFA